MCGGSERVDDRVDGEDMLCGWDKRVGWAGVLIGREDRAGSCGIIRHHLP